MRPVPAGRQRGQCCTPYSRLQEEIDNVETIAVTANNTANNAANAANTAVNTANGVAADAATALAGLTDGSVTKIGTSNVGTDTKPIKLVGGVPTIVTNELVDTATAQTVGGDKTYTGQQIATGQRAYNPANTDDIATIGTLDAYTPMVRTTGNQNKSGNLIFTASSGSGVLFMKGTNVDVAQGNYSASIPRIGAMDKNNVELWVLETAILSTGAIKLNIRIRNADGTIKTVNLAESNP